MFRSGSAPKDPYNFSLGSSATTTQKTQVKQQQVEKPKVVQPQSQTKGSKSKMVSNDLVPKRFGLNFNPPSIIIEYLVPQTGKLYHHKMKLIKLNGDTPANHALEYLKKKHYQYFMGNKMPEPQILLLIEKLKQKIKAVGSKRPETASTVASVTQKTSPQANLSIKSPAVVTTKPQINKKMKEEFDDYGNEDDDFSYDWKKGTQNTKQVSQPVSNKPISAPLAKTNSVQTPAQIKATAPQIKPNSAIVSKPQNSYNAPISKPQTAYNNKAPAYDEAYEDEEEYDEDEYDDGDGEDMDEEEYQRLYAEMGYDHLDLNKMSNEELNKHKAIMEQMYLKNAKKPGDPGYAYDMQAEFDPQMDNEWDMDEDDDLDIV